MNHQIGPYQLLESIGKGGMGEVFLAYDTSCGRKIALKRIRDDLRDHPQVYRRFLREARITCQLTHPAIIPIYIIHTEDKSAYYTMPFVEGETLKQLLRKTRRQEKKGETLDHVGGSIPALMRIFMTICQAVGYAHSKGVLHRDLKPENIIVGKYGEVLILDWGLAKMIGDPSEEQPEIAAPLSPKGDMTRIGKVVGTIAFMAPERALGQPATIQTDIYSLGVILYQLLTLRHPFKRGTLEEFRKNMAQEIFLDPVLVAPYRDVPRMLSRIAEKCLSSDPNERYTSVDELIHGIENYIEGRSEWIEIAQLDIENKDDWEFQENVLMAEHMAITRVAEEADWVSMMISEASFTGNMKLEADVCIGEDGEGIGFLINIPEAAQRMHLNDGYCLWIGSDTNKSTKLLRSTVEVVHAPDIFLRRHQHYRIRIEKIEQTLHLYIDDNLQFSYIAHLPLIGTHVGILSRDADFEISTLNVSVGSLNITVNCLAVPDAFLAHKNFTQALSEYRRIANSFHDRVEGREALFRIGLTLIEQAKESVEKEPWLNLALEEFEKLHNTPGAPLEYLGKALVYQVLNEYDEEIKCFELAYRRYPRHPLLPLLQEQIVSRMHELSRTHRWAAFQFILLAACHLPMSAADIHTHKLFNSLQKHWELLPFIDEGSKKDKTLVQPRFATLLAFWLAKPHILSEVIDALAQRPVLPLVEICNALFCLIELGAWDYAAEKIATLGADNFNPVLNALLPAIRCHYGVFEIHDNAPMRVILHILDHALDTEKNQFVLEEISKAYEIASTPEEHLELDLRRIEAYLRERNWQGASEILESYPLELLNKETTLLHFFYGCWLTAMEGKEIAHVHFSGVLHVSYPRTWTLGSHFIAENITTGDSWFEKAFLWEKRQLYRQMVIYSRCAGEEANEQEYKRLYEQQFLPSKP